MVYFLLKKPNMVNLHIANSILIFEQETKMYAKVSDFTYESGFPRPESPQAMSKNSVEFLVKMVCSELVELAQTVCSSDEAVEMIKNAATCDLNTQYQQPEKREHVIAEQADALIDCIYYIFNSGAKHDMRLDSVFELVHEANMSKKINGEFVKRADGKILKPQNWSEPDIKGYFENMN